VKKKDETVQKPAFMFAGQGAQSVGMGKDFAAASEAARRIFATADEVLGRPLSALCFEAPLEELSASRNCQPAIFTVSVAAVEAFRERCPVQPAACAGLSLGEFAALYAVGVFDFEDGLRLVEARGRFMDEACAATEGAMAAVLNADRTLLDRIVAEHDVDVANENCPGQVVISGERTKVERAAAALQAAGVNRVVMLQVAGAYHSRLMAPAADKFREVLERIPLRAPRTPVVQNVTGEPVSDPDEIRANLIAQITGTVRWEQCVRRMLDLGAEALLEFGPGRVLSGLARRIDRRTPVFSVGTVSDLETAVAAFCEGGGS